MSLLWDLLLPNLNFFTILGILAIIVGSIALFFTWAVSPFNLYSVIAIVSGIGLIWIPSIIEDLISYAFSNAVNTTITLSILAGIIIIGLIFYEPKNRRLKK